MRLINFIVISFVSLGCLDFLRAEISVSENYESTNRQIQPINKAVNPVQTMDMSKILADPAVKSSFQNLSEQLKEINKPQLHFSFGGESSGGANGLRCHNEENIILQDYLNDDPEFFEKFTSGDFIQISLFAKTLGYDRLSNLKAFSSYALAKHRLQLWQKNSPVIVSLVMEAMDRMTWLYTPYRQLPARGSKLSREIVQSCSNPSLFSIVVYDVRFGARISAPVWNSLGLFSQAGVLVHEALRHISHFYKSTAGQENSLTTEQIIYITKSIMTATPSTVDSLDKSTSYEGLLKELLNAHYKENPMELFCRIGFNVLRDVNSDVLAKYKKIDNVHLEDFTNKYFSFTAFFTEQCKKQKLTKMFDENSFIETRNELYVLKDAAENLSYSQASIKEMLEREKSLSKNKVLIWNLVNRFLEIEGSLIQKQKQFCQLLEACRPLDVFVFELDALRRELSGAYSDFLIDRIGSRVPQLLDLSKNTRFALLENAEIVLKKYLADANIELPAEVKNILDKYVIELQQYHRNLIDNNVMIKSF